MSGGVTLDGEGLPCMDMCMVIWGSGGMVPRKNVNKILQARRCYFMLKDNQ